MSRFKERLWWELVREHGVDLAKISRPAKRGPRARPRLLAGTTLGLAGLGTAIALVLSAASSSPAFAVSQNHDGTVTVVIRKFEAIHGANARLAELGLRARFVQVAVGCAVPPPGIPAGSPRQRDVTVRGMTVAKGHVNARFDPRRIPAGQTLVVGAWRIGRQVKVTPARVIRGAAPDCLPVPAPPRVIKKVGPAGSVQCIVPAPSPGGPSGNSRPPPSGDSGDSGNSGPPPANIGGKRSARPGLEVVPAPGGNSGNNGNSGNSGPPPAGNSGNSGPPPRGPERMHGAPHRVTCPSWSRAAAGKVAARASRGKTGKR